MRFGINLRGDLKKLSDAELAAQFEHMMEYHQTRFSKSPRVGSAKGMLYYDPEWPFGRGLIRHRLAYKIQIGYFWPFRGRRGTQYLVECEIKDLHDEMMRRVRKKKPKPAAAGNLA